MIENYAVSHIIVGKSSGRHSVQVMRNKETLGKVHFDAYNAQEGITQITQVYLTLIKRLVDEASISHDVVDSVCSSVFMGADRLPGKNVSNLFSGVPIGKFVEIFPAAKA